MTLDVDAVLSLLAIGSPIVSGAAAWYGAIGAVRVEMAKHEILIQQLRNDVDSDHARLNSISDRMNFAERR